MRGRLPSIVEDALDRARSLGFEMSSEHGVGQLLSGLAVLVPERGRILELGTGAGVGLSWLVHGIGGRDDVEVISVELDPQWYEAVGKATWPGFVSLRLGDGAELIDRLGRFDLIFADAPGGKLQRLDATIAALKPGGVLVLDDMDLSRHDDRSLREALEDAAHAVRAHADLATVELAGSSGILLAVRARGTKSSVAGHAMLPSGEDSTPGAESFGRRVPRDRIVTEWERMDARRMRDVEAHVGAFLREDEHYLASSAVYGDSGEEGLRRALRLLLERPELGFVWVGIARDEVVAACVVCFAVSTSTGTLVAKLDDVSVASEVRGKGVGSDLLSSLSAELRRLGVARIDTAVHVENAAARRFYERHGFRSLDEERLSLLLD